jgi:hypothetical protein
MAGRTGRLISGLKSTFRRMGEGAVSTVREAPARRAAALEAEQAASAARAATRKAATKAGRETIADYAAERDMAGLNQRSKPHRKGHPR